jgi:ATP-dependent DNA ligase
VSKSISLVRSDLFSVILDGEMLAWDPGSAMHLPPFGTLKTAALTAKENRDSDTSMHPLCKFP